MAELRTDAENGEMILKIFEHYKLRAGDVLQINTLMTYMSNHHIKKEDLMSGLDYAYGIDWIEETPTKALRLTQEGFDMM